jgi:guanylate kinase
MSRGTETAETLTDRVSKASYEISFKTHFDEVIINDDLERACFDAENLVKHFLEVPSVQSIKND